MMSDIKKPDYQTVDGLRFGGTFDPEVIREALNFKVGDNDLVLITYPKCGTNWARQVITLLRSKGVPCQTIQEFMKAGRFLEFEGADSLEEPEPRFLVTHLPYHLAPKSDSAKYIWVVRNPKDCLVSFYHHTCIPFYDFVDGDFNVYFDIFINGENDYGDYFDHVTEWYKHRNDPNVLMVYYEDMKRDLTSQIKRIAEFMGPEYADLIKDETVLMNIVKCCGFEYMKKTIGDDSGANMMPRLSPETDLDALPLPRTIKYGMKHMRMRNPALLEFSGSQFHMTRKGIVGDWRNNFTEDQNRRINLKIESKLKGTEMLDFWKNNNCL